MMCRTNLPHSFWGYALMTAARIVNLVPTKKVNKTPYEIWHGNKPKLGYLRVWGCNAYVTSDSGDKLDPRGEKVVFVGYYKKVDIISIILIQMLFLSKGRGTSSKKNFLIEELEIILWILKKFENHKQPLMKLVRLNSRKLLLMNQT